MRILICSTSTNNTDPVVNSLEYLGSHEIHVFRYDRKWNDACTQAVQQNPQVRELLQMGAWPAPEDREGFKPRVKMDAELLTLAAGLKPDVILYISAWEGLFVLDNQTLGEMNAIAPLVHMCFDASDPPWHPQMKTFEELGIFALTLNIDGGHEWPGGRDWQAGYIKAGGRGMHDWKIANGLTLLTPLDPRAFDGVQAPFNVRLFSVGYAGNAGGWIRNALVQRLQHELKGLFAFKQRDDNLGSYNHYCTFLRHCRVSISVPFTGSNATYHVKGRVLESGYAGACLLEWKNDATRAWFTPRFDFEEYESVEECCEMAQWLAGHPKRCEEIAANLHRRVTTEHSPEAFWLAVFSKLGLPA